MNIYIIPAWYPQDASDITACFFREQAHALADHGHNVTVIHITPVSCKQALNGPWRQRREWQDGNVRTIFFSEIIPIPAKLSKFQDWYISRVFTRIIRKQIKEDVQNGMQAPDIIHAHVSHSCGYYCLIASKKLNLPLVVTEHYSGLLLGTASRDDYERVRQTILRANAFIFVGSNFQKNIIERLHIQKKTYVVPNMIDTSLFPEVEEEKKDGFTFLTACSLNENKHVEKVIQAFHGAFSLDENRRLLIAGDGNERATLENLVEVLGEQSRIHFYGKYSRKEMPNLFRLADAFVMTSKVETFGIVYIEAMMCGLPCIGTAGQGADDIIDESNGIRVEFGDKKALENAMRRLVEHPEQYDRKGIRDNCIKKFSDLPIISELANIYKLINLGGGNYDGYTFLCACHLIKHKGVDKVIEAFHTAFLEYSNVRLVIAGDGKEWETLNQLTRKLNETSRILFIGRYNRKDVSQIFRIADAFVLVSQVEPFGVVYIEAQMCGLPCIGTAGQGADDIIDGSNGLKVPFGDVNALIDAMKSLFANKDKYNQQDIKRNCTSKFTAHAVCQKLECIYTNIT